MRADAVPAARNPIPLVFHLDSQARTLSRAGQTLAVPPKVFSLLLHLVENADRLVSRNELLASVWSDARVTGDAVRYAVRELRKTLGDPANAPGFVETVPRLGWRFIGRAVATGPSSWLVEPRSPAAREAAPVRADALHPGRQAEHAELQRALVRALAGERQLVLVSGEAGIGKTTLVSDFLAQVAGSERVAIGRGQCVESYGVGEAYGPLLEALERLCLGIGGDAPVAVLRRHAPMWLAALPSLTDPEERAALQLQLQGATQGRMLREFAQALEALSQQQPIALWLDDLHWCDVPTLRLLSHWMRRAEHARVLVLGGYRPADVVTDRTPLLDIQDELVAFERCRVLTLGFLSPDDIGEWLRSRLGHAASGARETLVRFVYEKTEGSPLFMRGVVDALVADGTLRIGEAASGEGGWELASSLEHVDIPGSVRRLIDREFGKLSTPERETLERASVAGAEFAVSALAAPQSEEIEVLEARCRELAGRRSFLVATGLADLPDGRVSACYCFVHALHREVLLEGLPESRRARLHREIGDRKAATFAGCESEVAVELLRHFEEGHDAARAAHFALLAGERAASRFANAEAIEHLYRALELTGRMPAGAERDGTELRARLALNVPLAAAHGYGAPELERNLERLQTLAGPLSDSPAAVPVSLGLWSLHIIRADLEQAESLSHLALRHASEGDDPLLQLQAHRTMGHTLFYRGDLDGARQHLSQALEGYDVSAHERLDYSFGDDPVVLCLSYASWMHWFAGEACEAVAASDSALALGERLAHPPSQVVAGIFAAVLHHLRGDARRALASARWVFELAEREGMELWTAFAQLMLGDARRVAGSEREGLEGLERGLANWCRTGSDLGVPYFLCIAGRARMRAGRLDEAREVLPHVDRLLRETRQRIFAPERDRLEGDLLLASGAPLDDAARCWRHGFDAACEMGAHALALRCALTQAEAFAHMQRFDAARPALEQALAACTGSDGEGDVVRAHRLLASRH